MKSAQGAVKETLGAAVGAKQMESEGTTAGNFTNLVTIQTTQDFWCCCLSTNALSPLLQERPPVLRATLRLRPQR